MPKKYDRVNAKQEAFLAELLRAPSISQAARQVGVSDSTARRWLREPGVHSAWLDLRRTQLDLALTGLQSSAAIAVKTLYDCLDKKYPAAVRVRAALGILDTATKAVELGELAQRIEQLEEALTDQQAEERAVKPLRLHA